MSNVDFERRVPLSLMLSQKNGISRCSVDLRIDEPLGYGTHKHPRVVFASIEHQRKTYLTRNGDYLEDFNDTTMGDCGTRAACAVLNAAYGIDVRYEDIAECMIVAKQHYCETWRKRYTNYDEYYRRIATQCTSTHIELMDIVEFFSNENWYYKNITIHERSPFFNDYKLLCSVADRFSTEHDTFFMGVTSHVCAVVSGTLHVNERIKNRKVKYIIYPESRKHYFQSKLSQFNSDFGDALIEFQMSQIRNLDSKSPRKNSSGTNKVDNPNQMTLNYG